MAGNTGPWFTCSPPTVVLLCAWASVAPSGVSPARSAATKQSKNGLKNWLARIGRRKGTLVISGLCQVFIREISGKDSIDYRLEVGLKECYLTIDSLDLGTRRHPTDRSETVTGGSSLSVPVLAALGAKQVPG